MPPPSSRLFSLNRFDRLVLVLIFFSVLTAAMTYPQIRVMDRALSDLGDPLLVTWIISWVAHQLPRDPLHLFDANIFYPERRTLAYSEPMIVPALLVAPVLWLGGSPVLAHNILLFFGFVVSGAGMYLLVRSLTNHVAAALFAGITFAFQPYRIDHYPHLQLQMTQWMPLGLWALHRTIAGGRLRDGLLTGMFVAFQALSSLYYGVFFTSYMILVGIALILGCHGRGLGRSARPLLGAGALATVLLVPLSLPYLANREVVGERNRAETSFFSAEPTSYLAPHPTNVLYPSLSKRFGAPEKHLFPGILVTVLAIVALCPPLSAPRIAYLLGLLFAFEASLGFNGFLYEWLYSYVLPYRGLRVPARFGILVGLTLAVLGGYGVARLCRSVHRPSLRRAMGIGVCLIAVGEYWWRPLHLVPVWRKPPSVYGWFRNQPQSVVIEFPIRTDLWERDREPIYMYFSTLHWHKLLNGSSGFHPPSYYDLMSAMRTFPGREAIDYLKQRSVDYLIVHSAFYEPKVYAEITSQLDGQRNLTFLGRFPWGINESRLYRLNK